MLVKHIYLNRYVTSEIERRFNGSGGFTQIGENHFGVLYPLLCKSLIRLIRVQIIFTRDKITPECVNLNILM